MKILHAAKIVSGGESSAVMAHPTSFLNITEENPFQLKIAKHLPDSKPLFAMACSAIYHGPLWDAVKVFDAAVHEAALRHLIQWCRYAPVRFVSIHVIGGLLQIHRWLKTPGCPATAFGSQTVRISRL